MKAALYTSFRKPLTIENVSDPKVEKDGAIIQVKATGICRSDWQGWMGHDADVRVPHVPGHELTGIIMAVGGKVRNWKRGDRVTLPFSSGCGNCDQCNSGNQQICDNYFQPGFTAWGSFAEYVHVKYVDVNLVRLPEEMSFTDAAILGCRFITAYRGVTVQGKLKASQWIGVHGCGGVGLSAIMIAHALGAKVIAVDIDDDKLNFAQTLGAHAMINAMNVDDIPSAIKELTKGGVHVSVDALGSTETCQNSINSLRKRGKHIQIGLMTGIDTKPAIDMTPVIANELEIIGSHGMQAHQYPSMLDLIHTKKIPLSKLIGKRMDLEAGAKALTQMDTIGNTGVMVINKF